MPRTFASILLTASVFALAGTAASAALHFGLDRSLPEADATVHAVESVELWFTQVPQEGTTSIRLVDAAGDLVSTGDVVQDPEDGTHFSVTPDGPVAAGAYTVAWRGMGQDGHVIRDDFAFTVAAH